MRRVVLSGLAAATLSSGAVVGLATPAWAGTCGQTFAPATSGAKAYWQVNCNSTQSWISGWVEDTAANGRCAAVKAIWPNGTTWFSNRACPKGTRVYFTSAKHGGHSVNGYLYEFNV
jgi:hypothetical protein